MAAALWANVAGVGAVQGSWQALALPHPGCAPCIQELTNALSSALVNLPGPDLVDCVVALADLQHHPGAAWLAVHTAAVNARVADLSVYQVRKQGSCCECEPFILQMEMP